MSTLSSGAVETGADWPSADLDFFFPFREVGLVHTLLFLLFFFFGFLVGGRRREAGDGVKEERIFSLEGSRSRSASTSPSTSMSASPSASTSTSASASTSASSNASGSASRSWSGSEEEEGEGERGWVSVGGDSGEMATEGGGEKAAAKAAAMGGGGGIKAGRLFGSIDERLQTSDFRLQRESDCCSLTLRV